MTLAVFLLIVVLFACYAASRSASAALALKRLMIVASALWLIICGILQMSGGGMPAVLFIEVALVPIAVCWAFVIAILWAVAPRHF